MPDQFTKEVRERLEWMAGSNGPHEQGVVVRLGDLQGTVRHIDALEARVRDEEMLARADMYRQVCDDANRTAKLLRAAEARVAVLAAECRAMRALDGAGDWSGKLWDAVMAARAATDAAHALDEGRTT